uniref:Uncharacterized protein n=1 Tax=viral metagenome TaxID=1070528 RepID=A0A6M3LL33_9ZZZZ
MVRQWNDAEQDAFLLEPTESQVEEKLSRRGINQERICRATLEDIGDSVKSWLDHAKELQQKRGGSKPPNWGLGYLGRVLAEKENTNRVTDRQQERVDAKKNKLAEQIAEDKAIQNKIKDDEKEMWKQFNVLPSEHQLSIINSIGVGGKGVKVRVWWARRKEQT